MKKEEPFDDRKGGGWKLSVAINDRTEIQLGPNGHVLKWTLLHRFRVSIDMETNKATFALADSEFKMIVLWDTSDESSIMHRLILEPSGAVQGILELSWIVPNFTNDEGEEGEEVEEGEEGKGKGKRRRGKAKGKGKEGKGKNEIVGRCISDANRVSAKPLSKYVQPSSSSSSSSSATAKQQQQQKRPKTEEEMDMEFFGNSPRINIVRDTDSGVYMSLIHGTANNTLSLEGYSDPPLSATVVSAIQTLIDMAVDPQLTFAQPSRVAIVTYEDARRVIPMSSGPQDLWINSFDVEAYLHYLRHMQHTIDSNIHIHPSYTCFHLYHYGWRSRKLAEQAFQLASQQNQLNIMTTRFMSIIVVNLYNDHWYILIIYPAFKRIDILNWLPTSSATVRMLSRLMHAYLRAHDMIDPDFTFTPEEWSICVISINRVPRQLNGYDCGAFTLRAIEYLVAGHALTFTQSTMRDFRSKIVLVFRLKDIPWIRDPTALLDDAAIITSISSELAATLAENDQYVLPEDEQEYFKYDEEAQAELKKKAVIDLIEEIEGDELLY